MTPVHLPAPGRGAYDRSLSRAERDHEQRERLFRAAVMALGDGELTLKRLIECAGTGRSTFYEFFDSLEHLLAQLEQRLLRPIEHELRAALANESTPTEKLRAIARAWWSVIEADPVEARIILDKRPGGSAFTPAGSALHRALQLCVDQARSARLPFKSSDDVSVLAAAAAGEAVARRHVSSTPVRDGGRALGDIIIKLLR